MKWLRAFARYWARHLGNVAMAILTVGPNQQFPKLSAAIAASHDGDTIYVQHGTYSDDFSYIGTAVHIIGVGGMAQLVAKASPPNRKAILVTSADITLDHLEFTGATVPNKNGAGIRYEGGNLTIANSYFHENQMGLLAAGVTTGSITIDRSEFDHNLVADGSDSLGHNLYIGGPVGHFRVTNSYFHDAVIAHQLKSRALNSDIENNRIFDNDGTASYSIDLPNGGNAIIKNNIIQQSPNSDNPAIIAYSAETTSPWAGSKLTITGNTIINQMVMGSPVGIKNFSRSITASVTGNRIYGLSAAQIASGPNMQSGNHMLASLPALDRSHPWAQSPWDNLISGGASADILSGTARRDLFVGGGGSDTFTIKKGGGNDTIADFVAGPGAGNVVHLEGYAFTGFAAVQAAMVQKGENTVLNLGNGETLTFLHAQKSAFAPDDFAF